MLATKVESEKEMPRVVGLGKTLCMPCMCLSLHSVIKPSKSMGT